MVLAKVATLRLKGTAGDTLSYCAFVKVEDWLTQWSLDANIKQVIAATPQDAVNKLRDEMDCRLIPSWLRHTGVGMEHFVFTIAYSEIDSDGMVWPPIAHWTRAHSGAE